MSTRATYTIKSKNYSDKTDVKHFYIHYDGYLEGAAEYFKAFVELTNSKGGNAERFLRANDQAEFTPNPECHGDTEFHYELEPDLTIKAYSINHGNWESGHTPNKSCEFSGDLADFLNKYLEPIESPFYGKIKADYVHFGRRIISRKKLEQEYINNIQQGLYTHAVGAVGNAGSYLSDAYKIDRFLNPTKEIPKEILFFAELQRGAFQHDCTPLAFLQRVYGQ